MFVDDMQLYWVQLTQVLSYGNVKLKDILNLYSTPQNFLEAGVDEWKKCEFLTLKNIKRLKDSNLSKAEKIIKEKK